MDGNRGPEGMETVEPYDTGVAERERPYVQSQRD